MDYRDGGGRQQADRAPDDWVPDGWVPGEPARNCSDHDDLGQDGSGHDASGPDVPGRNGREPGDRFHDDATARPAAHDDRPSGRWTDEDRARTGLEARRPGGTLPARRPDDRPAFGVSVTEDAAGPRGLFEGSAPRNDLFDDVRRDAEPVRPDGLGGLGGLFREAGSGRRDRADRAPSSIFDDSPPQDPLAGPAVGGPADLDDRPSGGRRGVGRDLGDRDLDDRDHADRVPADHADQDLADQDLAGRGFGDRDLAEPEFGGQEAASQDLGGRDLDHADLAQDDGLDALATAEQRARPDLGAADPGAADPGAADVGDPRSDSPNGWDRDPAGRTDEVPGSAFPVRGLQYEPAAADAPVAASPADDRTADPMADGPAPDGPAPEDPAVEALGPVLAEFATRRRAAQETAATAEAVAAAAAERAAAAIADAARAADEAEAAAEVAARAAEEAAAAADAERRAVAAAGGRVAAMGSVGRSQAAAVPEGTNHTVRVSLGPQFAARPGPPIPPPPPPRAAAYPGPPGSRPEDQHFDQQRPRGPEQGGRRQGPPAMSPDGPGQPGPGQPGPGQPGQNGSGQTGPWRRPPVPPGAPQAPPRGWLPDGAATVAGMPPAGGRVARRRAAESSGMIDPDSTEVLTGLHALREPPRSGAPAPGSAEVTAVTRVPPPVGRTGPGDSDEPDEAADPDHVDAYADAHVDDLDDVEEDAVVDHEPIGWAARLPARPVLAAVAVVLALVVVAVVAAVTGSRSAPEPAPAAVVGATTSAPAVPPAGTGALDAQETSVDPHSKKAVAYLTALRDADIPTSRSGQDETEAAAVICQQLRQGTDETTLVRTLPAVLPDLTRAQAAEVVEQAQQHYC